MTRRRAPAFLGVGLAVAIGALALVVARGTIATGSLDPEKAVQLSKSDAVSLAAEFAGATTEHLSVTGPVQGAIEDFYIVDGPEISATVDVHDGHIITLVFAGIVSDKSDIAITEADALSTAQEFLRARELEPVGYERTAELVNHGDTNEFVITWQRMDGKVVVPDSRIVAVDAASGRVFRFATIQRAYQPPGEPKVDEATAVQIAQDATGLGGLAEMDKLELRVSFDAMGTQLLLWNVYLSGPATGAPEGSGMMSHFAVEVNASTGSATIIGRG